MKTCLLSYRGNFDNSLGMGTQRYTYELWTHLAKHEVIYTDKIEVGLNYGHPKLNFVLALPFQSFDNYDLVHLPSPAPFAPNINPKKTTLVTTATEFILLDEDSPMMIAQRRHEKKNPPPRSKLITDWITQACRKQILNSDYIIAISSLVKEEAIKQGIDKSRIFVTALGVDKRFNKPIPAKEDRKKFIVGYLGAHNIRKNVSFAIEAFKKLKGEGFEFHIWGRGPETENLKILAKDDKRIKFMGFAPEEKLVEVYDSFDVMLYPILYTGFEMEILEAQARGIPVITYKDATIPEEVNKFCYKAKDVETMSGMIETLFTYPYCDPWRAEAMAYARSFTWERTANETIAAYNKMVE